jgi:hypothetical protein
MRNFEEPSHPPTLIAWAPYFRDGEFKEWVKIGRGYPNGKMWDVYTNCLPHDFNGEMLLLPVGKEPTQLPSYPANPPQQDNE